MIASGQGGRELPGGMCSSALGKGFVCKLEMLSVKSLGSSSHPHFTGMGDSFRVGGMIAETRGDPLNQKDFLWFTFEQHQTKSDPAAPSHQVLGLILGTMHCPCPGMQEQHLSPLKHL